jgi:hypothetical protein
MGNECQKDVFGQCCCECKWHVELMSHPLMDGRLRMGVVSYTRRVA